MPRGPTPYDRPAGNLGLSRSPVLATSGAAATSQPLATLAALDVLRDGGNAVDAAIAANAMLGLVEPNSCGIGGDLFAIVWDASTGSLHGLNASGRSPFALDRDELTRRGHQKMPETGPLSWSVPGCVDGWHLLLERFGTRALGELLAPAVETAERGFPLTEVIASGWAACEQSLAAHEDSRRTYMPRGRLPRAGEVFRNPYLAASYRLLAAEGRDGFYRGSIAEQIVRHSQDHGGCFSLRDLAEHTSEWVEPVGTSYRGFDVWELPPNGQGIAVLQMLNLLEPYNIASMEPGGADFLHLFTEAKKLAFADRARYYADPAGQRLPIAELISKDYARRRGASIDPLRAATDVTHGDPFPTHGDTVYLTVVDADRNCCSLIQSNYVDFGSQMVPGDLGFVLQNRGSLFTLDQGHPNGLAPHKRPFHTIIPALVTRDNRPWLSFGVMGGDMQPQGHVQVLVAMIDWAMNVQRAGDLPRARHVGSATPTGEPAAAGGGTLTVESGIGEGTIAELRRRGHQVMRASGGFGGYQGIHIDCQQGVLHAGSDPRKDGCALGY